MINLSQAHADWRSTVATDDGPTLADSWDSYLAQLVNTGSILPLQYTYAPAHADQMPGTGSQWDTLRDDRNHILRAMGISMRHTSVRMPEHRQDLWGKGATHWAVTLRRRDGASIKSGYTMGSAHTGNPELSNVLACLLIDATSAELSHVDWCAETGHDPDSRKAERMYRACRSIARSLARLFSDAELACLHVLYQDM